MKYYAMFYKGKGNITDKSIRLRTFSIYSHVEFVVCDNDFNPNDFDAGTKVLAYTSSFRDGGVVKRELCIKPENWDFVPIDWVDQEDVEAYYKSTKNANYDLLGVLVGQLLKVRTHNENQYFCSEWVGSLLRLDEPWRYSPGLLYLVLKSYNGINSKYVEKSYVEKTINSTL